MSKKLAVAVVILTLCGFSFLSAQGQQTRSTKKTFTNPLRITGPDPWVIQKDGLYYFCRSTGSDLQLIATPKMSSLKDASSVVVWTPPDTGMFSKELWAPELHYLNHKWYLYFAADDGNNDHHRMYVLENDQADPLSDHWILKGKIADKTNKWAIDGSVFTYKNKNYFIWSGWEGDQNTSQNIYIAELENPWTIKGERVMLSTPEYAWEKEGSGNGLPKVNEGPEGLRSPHGQMFLVYSASGCWTDHYALGMLSLRDGGNPMNAKDWTKSPEPVFASATEDEVYAPGHNGFFKSVDGKEDWIIFHANDKAGLGCGNFRSPRMQSFKWRKDGTPDFGKPLKAGVPMAVPSGE